MSKKHRLMKNVLFLNEIFLNGKCIARSWQRKYQYKRRRKMPGPEPKKNRYGMGSSSSVKIPGYADVRFYFVPRKLRLNNCESRVACFLTVGNAVKADFFTFH